MFREKDELCLQYIKDLFEFNKSSCNLRMKEFMTPRFNTTSKQASKQAIKQSINQSIDQSINQSIPYLHSNIKELQNELDGQMVYYNYPCSPRAELR